MNRVMLTIMDGWGLGKSYPGNAVELANTPNYDYLIQNYPNTTLDASGLAVGLPKGQMGNSEVGHLNIGAGRVIYQEFTKISKEIEEGKFFDNAEFNKAVDFAVAHDSNLHLMGLISDGGVHSHIEHVYALLELCKYKKFNKVYVHAFLDGRDVAPTIGATHIGQLLDKMNELQTGKLATISGRYYAMDRDNRWERVKLAYNAMLLGQGIQTSDPVKAILDSYKENITDEFLKPHVVIEGDQPVTTINDDDSIIFFNFRPDRARELTRAIVEDDDFNGFYRTKKADTYFVTFTLYDKTIDNVHVAYPPESYKNTLGEYISRLGLKQLRIAETEKYAHVTFFFNGGVEAPNPMEDRILIPSPKVATYDLQPEMSAFQVKDEVIKQIQSNKYELIILNFANPDMVGHTGVIPSVIKAVETVDTCLGEILREIDKHDDITLFVTADHGNAEQLIDENTGETFTAHTTNKVPFIAYPNKELKLKEGKLCDIAPTILEVMGIQQPIEMTGQTLLNKEKCV